MKWLLERLRWPLSDGLAWRPLWRPREQREEAGAAAGVQPGRAGVGEPPAPPRTLTGSCGACRPRKEGGQNAAAGFWPGCWEDRAAFQADGRLWKTVRPPQKFLLVVQSKYFEDTNSHPQQDTWC